MADIPRRIIAGLEEVTIEPVRRVRGKGFKWNHGIQIALPASYGQTNRSYPVLWITLAVLSTTEHGMGGPLSTIVGFFVAGWSDR